MCSSRGYKCTAFCTPKSLYKVITEKRAKWSAETQGQLCTNESRRRPRPTVRLPNEITCGNPCVQTAVIQEANLPVADNNPGRPGGTSRLSYGLIQGLRSRLGVSECSAMPAQLSGEARPLTHSRAVSVGFPATAVGDNPLELTRLWTDSARYRLMTMAVDHAITPPEGPIRQAVVRLPAYRMWAAEVVDWSPWMES